eukprot:2818361-Rhodomonas_salina.3
MAMHAAFAHKGVLRWLPPLQAMRFPVLMFLVVPGVRWIAGGWVAFMTENVVLSHNRQSLAKKRTAPGAFSSVSLAVCLSVCLSVPLPSSLAPHPSLLSLSRSLSLALALAFSLSLSLARSLALALALTDSVERIMRECWHRLRGGMLGSSDPSCRPSCEEVDRMLKTLDTQALYTPTPKQETTLCLPARRARVFSCAPCSKRAMLHVGLAQPTDSTAHSRRSLDGVLSTNDDADADGVDWGFGVDLGVCRRWDRRAHEDSGGLPRPPKRSLSATSSLAVSPVFRSLARSLVPVSSLCRPV